MYDDDELGPEDLCRHGKPRFLICSSCQTPIRQWRLVSEVPTQRMADGSAADLALKLADNTIISGWYGAGHWFNRHGRHVKPIEWLALSELMS